MDLRNSNDNDFIIIIDDKSISTVGIIAATCAKKHNDT